MIHTHMQYVLYIHAYKHMYNYARTHILYTVSTSYITCAFLHFGMKTYIGI